MSLQYSLFFIQRFKGKVLFDVPMSEYTSFKIGGPADVMAFPTDDGDLKDIVGFAEAKRFPYYVLGGGTNLLVRDSGIRGIVINMSEGFGDILWQDSTKAVVGAGVKLKRLVAECAERGLSGMEFACGIPGTVGGATAMNAGAYGFEMKDVVEGVEYIGKRGKKGFVPSSELGFGYRSASLPPGAVVVRVHMNFELGDKAVVKARMDEFRMRRKATSSIGVPNAGSVFKNPEGDSAGRLIDDSGLKGASSGRARVSEVHANYIVNPGGATAKDVLALMGIIRDRVYGKKGVVLEPEIKIVGAD